MYHPRKDVMATNEGTVESNSKAVFNQATVAQDK